MLASVYTARPEHSVTVSAEINSTVPAGNDTKYMTTENQLISDFQMAQ